MRHSDFLNSLTEQAAGNVYKKNSVMGKKRINESIVRRSGLGRADMRRGFQPVTNQEFGPEPSASPEEEREIQQRLADPTFRQALKDPRSEEPLRAMFRDNPQAVSAWQKHLGTAGMLGPQQGSSQPVAQQASAPDQQQRDARRYLGQFHSRIGSILRTVNRAVWNIPLTDLEQFSRLVRQAVGPYEQVDGGEYSGKAVFPDFYQRDGAPWLEQQ